jgi:tetratricopeptide (TPR) repeat protein
MKISFMSQKNAEALRPDNTMALISIVAPTVTRNPQPGWGARIDMVFNDITHIDPEDDRYKGYILFNEEMAKEMALFIKNLPSQITHIVVHCLAGVSRSAAVAKVLCEYYKQEFTYDYPYFNMLVYTLFKEAVAKYCNFAFKSNAELALDCFEQGNKSLEGKHYLTAIQYYDMAVKYNPGLSQAYFARGVCKFLKEGYEQAIIDFDRVIEIKPGTNFIYLWRGKARKIIGDDKGAAEDLAVGLKTDPENNARYDFKGIIMGDQLPPRE